ncbi:MULTISPECIES: SPOR domain-containing protein [Thalassospira]|uniref:Energy transducer TonB n=2 Tax=Thalassospira TaxID=168934 RepID=A0A367VZC8_9PROT|nr:MULTISPECIES: SPOR domain-containing protein [Thalassospira]MDG4721631.1 SPOR domain-containing protein [Thalassospira sp. FZY0004]RCK31353.1 energy transducer TonB [Thalassospira profundimaris]
MNEEYGRNLHAERADHYQAEKPARKSMMKGAVTVFFGLAVVAGGLGGAGYWFYHQGQPIQDDGKLPILLPDPSPIKLRPEDPGGMEVPHRNTTVYDQLNDVDPDANVVLQELPDMPRAPEVVATPKAPETTASVDSWSEGAVEATPDAVNPSASIDATAATSSDAVSAPDIAKPEMTDAEKALAAAAERDAETQKATKPVAPASTPQSAAVSLNDFRIQLASVRDESGAAAEWKRLSSKNKDLLASLQMFVQRTDLGGKGVFYRLQAGPLTDASAAEKLCGDLKQRNVGCLIVRP